MHYAYCITVHAKKWRRAVQLIAPHIYDEVEFEYVGFDYEEGDSVPYVETYTNIFCNGPLALTDEEELEILHLDEVIDITVTAILDDDDNPDDLDPLAP